jgi:hypothetical protein
MGRTVSVGYDSGRPDVPRRASRPGRRGRPHRSAAAPLTRRFLVLKLFAPFGDFRDRTNLSAQSHVFLTRVAGTSRTDHDVARQASVQVRRRFYGSAEFARPACLGETDHHEFVSWPTADGVPPATIVTSRGAENRCYPRQLARIWVSVRCATASTSP